MFAVKPQSCHLDSARGAVSWGSQHFSVEGGPPKERSAPPGRGGGSLGIVGSELRSQDGDLEERGPEQECPTL